VPLQLPIGAEETFRGVVDLLNFKGIILNEMISYDNMKDNRRS